MAEAPETVEQLTRQGRRVRCLQIAAARVLEIGALLSAWPAPPTWSSLPR